ncbi:MAG TPA: hypothetical protein VH969_07300 [Actinophytocola sp.]|jgi:uncharacterized membrane protein|uniref:DUF7144 family membrane protein n=1 Tax=Actinophytocola sp. TaxID=1872138 RepID=UPI002F94FF1B
MTDAQATGAGSTAVGDSRDTTQPKFTAWVGWIWFAALMMILLGFFNALYGLVALFNDTYYAVGARGLLVFDITQWGWIHLIVGLAAVVTGFALRRGAMWARVLAVVLASINAVAHLAFMSANPWWAVVAIVFDVLVIWAVIVHGGEMKENAY